MKDRAPRLLAAAVLPVVLVAVLVGIASGSSYSTGSDAPNAKPEQEREVRTYSVVDFGHTPVADAGFSFGLVTGDFDNNGLSDLAVSAPADSAQAQGGGWVGVSSGNARFPGPVHAQAGGERDGEWGAALAVGDFDDDGYDDLVIGAPGRDFSGPDSGVMYLWAGSASGVGQQSRPFGPSLGSGARVGSALAVGDYNGDGVDDIAVGAPGAVVEGQSGAGMVVLLPGRAGAGPIATGGLTLERGEAGVPGTSTARERLGTSLASGDFDGDGRSELVVGAPYGAAGGVSEAGLVLAVTFATYPVTGGLRVDQLAELSRDSDDVPGDAGRSGWFGAGLAAGDFNGDRMADLVVSSPGAFVGGKVGAGDIVVFYGRSGFPDQSRTSLLSRDTPGMPGQSAARESFGAALAAGDVDGDARDDLVIGAPNTRVGSRTGVGTSVVIGSGTGDLDPATGIVVEPGLDSTGSRPTGREAFGSSLLIGDLNGDGLADLAIGVPGMAAGGADRAGALVVVWGDDPDLPGVATATRLPVTPTRQATASPTPGATATVEKVLAIALPYVTRLRSLDIWGTPVP